MENAKPTKIDGEFLAKKKADAGDIFVLFTGGKYRARKTSGRFLSLGTVKEVGKPIPLATVYERAATVAGPKGGFSPDLVRSGLFLHQGAKPAVYIALEKNDKGEFVAAKDVAMPDEAWFGKRSFKAGDIVRLDRVGTGVARKATPPKAVKAEKAKPKKLAGKVASKAKAIEARA